MRWFWPFFVLFTAYGACVGSFLNVVILRTPEGKSLWRSQSACPKCGRELRWFENVPILAWLALRGRCDGCRSPISPQYLLVEVLGAVLYAGMFYVYYKTDFRPEFREAGLAPTWPILVTHLILVGGLLAATVIDARHYIIPLNIPWFTTGVTLLLLPVAAVWVEEVERFAPATTSDRHLHTVLGAAAGLSVAVALLWRGLLPRSFDDIEQYLPPASPPATEPAAVGSLPEPQSVTDIHDWLAYPHARREMGKELLFLAFPIAGALIGRYLVPTSDLGLTSQTYPLPLHVLAGVVLGYLVGGALIWFTRILGTLAFGKEAMGLGDVHLLAAVGAALGAMDTTMVFFLAPFIGLTYAAVQFGLTSVLKVRHRPIPYGPHLAVAALCVMLLRQPILDFYRALLKV